jgi:hypothetical protein
MPLRTLYHPSEVEWKPWVGFNNGWACTILSRLNLEVLSQDYRASLDVHKPIFAIPTFEAIPNHIVSEVTPDRGFPPSPVMSEPVEFLEPRATDLTVTYEPTHQIVAVVAFAHPDFTESAAGRRAFAVKCARWLQRGTTVVAVNAWLPADLHREVVDLLRLPDPVAWRSPTELSAVVYRVVRLKEHDRLDVWPFPLTVGSELPTVPLWLAADLAVPLELELSYEAVCKSLRIR